MIDRPTGSTLPRSTASHTPSNRLIPGLRSHDRKDNKLYDQVARAQALLLDRRRISPAALVAAYRTVRTATPDAYSVALVDALMSYGHDLHGEQQIAAWQEAVEVARSAAEADPRESRGASSPVRYSRKPRRWARDANNGSTFAA